MSQYNTRIYSEIKNKFKEISQNNPDLVYQENKETCAVCLKISRNDKELGFYYLFGNSQAHEINGDDVFVLPTDVNALEYKIVEHTKDWLKKINK